MIVAHLMACAWYYTAVMEDSAYYDKWPHKQGQIWSCIEGEEDDGPQTWLRTAGILCAPNGIKYMAAFYFSTMTITTVGYVEYIDMIAIPTPFANSLLLLLLSVLQFPIFCRTARR